MEKYISYVKFPLGYIEIIANDEYLLEVNFTNIIKEIRSNNITAETAKQLNEYFNYERMSFDLPFKLDGTSFQIKCWQQLLEIPYGSTITYKEQAQLIGHPKAYRAVGQANGKNKLVI
ncbi:MAG TPA: methylated-DNA--[protein]-cysteine S-methyltransferase, partial [Bacilli bacterium]|nr:methylated-DNA--[protein]-cysteine S-methyltransferase [Bacilli bacterium]